MTKAAIELVGVSKTFRQGLLQRRCVKALDSLTLNVDEGEAFGFVGQNGAGKSTTIKILTGALHNDTGEARLLGVDVSDFRSRRGVGYVPENPWLYEYLSPYEIVHMGVVAHGQSAHGDVKTHCMHWLERFGVADVAHRLLRGFSKGMLQRTALAHALACNPRLLILDEPLSGLDPLGRREVVDVLVEFRRNGGTIFFSSHVLHDVERLADRFGLIHKGVLREVRDSLNVVEQDGSYVVRTVGRVAIEGMNREVGQRWSAEVSKPELWPLMEKINRAGHQIVEVKSGMTLEKVFIDLVSAAGTSDDEK